MQIIWNITPAISLCFHYHFMAASQDNMTTSLVAFAWELWILKLTFVELLLSSLCNWSLILNIPLLISPWAYTVWNLCTVNSMHATYDSALHSALWIAEFFFPCLWFQKQRTSGLGMILHLLSSWFFSSCSQHQLTVQRKFFNTVISILFMNTWSLKDYMIFSLAFLLNYFFLKWKYHFF